MCGRAMCSRTPGCCDKCSGCFGFEIATRPRGVDVRGARARRARRWAMSRTARGDAPCAGGGSDEDDEDDVGVDEVVDVKRRRTHVDDADDADDVVAGEESDGKIVVRDASRITIGSDAFQVSDAVLVKAPGTAERYVGKICAFKRRGTRVEARLCWYYRPQETRGGRKRFHGVKELFSSDHYDWVDVNTIDAKCNVYPLKDYQKLKAVGEGDFYARFLYRSSRGEFRPEAVPVFCACSEPYNPDRFMVECEECEDWFHPECVGHTQASAARVKRFTCPQCVAVQREKALGLDIIKDEHV
jgi:hypothetical protein